MLGETHILNPSGRFIIIGDLHGMFYETLELIDKCKLTPADQVIFCGDLVDRGKRSAACVDYAQKYSSILGNHEQKHLYYRDIEEKTGSINIILPSHHIETRNQLTQKHYDYFRSLPYYIRLPEFNAVVVHAGVFPGIPIEEQNPNHLLHIQMINPAEGTESKWPSKVPNDSWKFWTHFWDGPERIIFGHTVLDKPLITDKAVGIDTGACFGGDLSALILPGWDIVSVKAKESFDRKTRGREGIPIAPYVIHNDVRTYS